MANISNSAFMNNLRNQSNRDGSYRKYGQPFGMNMATPVVEPAVQAIEEPSLLDKGLGWAESFLAPDTTPKAVNPRERRAAQKARRALLRDAPKEESLINKAINATDKFVYGDKPVVAPEAGNFPINNNINPKSYGMDGRNTPVSRPTIEQTKASPVANSAYPSQSLQRSGLEEFFAANAAAPTRVTPQVDRLAMLQADYQAGNGYGTEY